MCFSAEADLVAGVVATGVGIDVCRHIAGRRDLWLLASIPLVLGAHQLIEVFVWWGLQGHIDADIGRVAMWVYLIVAFVVLPVLVPLAVLTLEPTPARRNRMIPFVAVGTVVSVLLAWGLARGPVDATIKPWHLAYTANLSHGIAISGLYVVAVCGALLLSGVRYIVIFGLANLVAVVTIGAFTISGFASLWCIYAALSAAAVAIHVRLSTRTLLAVAP